MNDNNNRKESMLYAVKFGRPLGGAGTVDLAQVDAITTGKKYSALVMRNGRVMLLDPSVDVGALRAAWASVVEQPAEVMQPAAEVAPESVVPPGWPDVPVIKPSKRKRAKR